MSGIGIAVTWKTKIDHKPKLGEEFVFPCITGPARFTVTEMRGNHCLVESGDLQGKITQDEEGTWYFKHMLIDKNLKCRVSLTDAVPPPNPMNSNIGFKKTYK